MKKNFKKYQTLLLIVLTVFISSCKSDKRETPSPEHKEQTISTLLDVEETGIDFVNQVVNSK